MTIPSSQERIGWLTFLVLVTYAVLLVVALNFRPTTPFITDDWREAAKYERDCKGYANTVQIWDGEGTHYEITCEKAND
jgi:hypothetical protein